AIFIWIVENLQTFDDIQVVKFLQDGNLLVHSVQRAERFRAADALINGVMLQNHYHDLRGNPHCFISLLLETTFIACKLIRSKV
uniref:Calponin-homology (CH) domain-containing protein n=1 Tax=Pygocentrus nattereri TaxID=42514 RepID=A0AAR2KQY6_PYGNA